MIFGCSMLCHLRPLMLIALVMLTGQGADAQTAYEITPDSPIIVTPVAHTLVWQEPANSRLGIDQVLQRSNEFKPANDMGPIDAFSTYWVMQKFVNRLDADREYMLEGPGWLTVNSYILKTGKLVQPLKPFSFIQGEYSFLSDVDPAKPYSAKVPSQYPLFTLYKNEELVVVSQLKAYPSLPPKTFALRLIDKSKFGEVRRFGLYIEGALLACCVRWAFLDGFLTSPTETAPVCFTVCGSPLLFCKYSPYAPKMVRTSVNSS